MNTDNWIIFLMTVPAIDGATTAVSFMNMLTIHEADNITTLLRSGVEPRKDYTTTTERRRNT